MAEYPNEADIPVHPNMSVTNTMPLIGYTAGWSQHFLYGPLRAWGLTPRSARRRWLRRRRRVVRKELRCREIRELDGGRAK
jgi:hypothetical protein